METLAANLPHVNASLNLLATILLIAGSITAHRGRYDLHKRIMITCFAVSVVFLGCYLMHKYALFQTTGAANKPFPRDPSVAPDAARYAYFAILITHLILAITVPPLAIWSIILGYRDRRAAHRKVVKFAWPIWLYVSVTGVIVYLMLYQIYVVK